MARACSSWPQVRGGCPARLPPSPPVAWQLRTYLLGGLAVSRCRQCGFGVCLLVGAASAGSTRYSMPCAFPNLPAPGVRNTVGFDFHPVTGTPFFTDNGRDREWGGLRASCPVGRADRPGCMSDRSCTVGRATTAWQMLRCSVATHGNCSRPCFEGLPGLPAPQSGMELTRQKQTTPPTVS